MMLFAHVKAFINRVLPHVLFACSASVPEKTLPVARKADGMEKATIAILTSAFPYYPGEQFIEPEIEYWSGLSWARVVICPYTVTGTARDVPDDIEVFVEENNHELYKIWYVTRALRSIIFWRELRYLRSAGKLSFGTIVAAIRSVAITLAASRRIKKIVNYLGHIDVAYCYWNTERAYAACLLKRKGKISAVVSRAHGYDLYEQRRRRGYMPLKRQFTDDFDAVYAISDEGKIHLADTYKFSKNRLSVSRLGVDVATQNSIVSSDDVIRVLSVSFCVPVKRVDRIIDAISCIAKTYPAKHWHWTHIGDGPLRQKLETLAQEKFGLLSNVTWRFTGTLSNEQVLSFYDENPVDIFINCSESEGVPVSIMEAMARGVPAIAPSVGGIPELVNETCGELLPPNFSSTDVVSAILKLTDLEASRYRLAARDQVVKKYNANANFSTFVDSIHKISMKTSMPGGDSLSLRQI